MAVNISIYLYIDGSLFIDGKRTRIRDRMPSYFIRTHEEHIRNTLETH